MGIKGIDSEQEKPASIAVPKILLFVTCTNQGVQAWVERRFTAI
jgi:hypothetical protein